MNKNTKIVAALITLGLVSPMAYATNGDEMMAIGTQSTALGGTGVANYIGADSAWANPAMLGKSTGSEIVGGLVYFKPTVTNTGMGGTAQTSGTNPSIIPDISYSSRINNNMSYGVAFAGIAGMGVDYSGASYSTHIAGKTVMSIARLMGTFAYNDTDYGVGISPILQYGSLAISYTNTGGAYNPTQKADTSTGFGASVGGYYNVTPAVVVAAAYQSAIEMTYGTQLSGAGTQFGLCSPAGGSCTGLPTFGDKLAQPAELKLGVAYTMSDFTLTADYKSIQWSAATGYKDFNWKDQTVVAIGAKYAGNGYWLGAGYNQANDPIGEVTPSANPASIEYRNAALNFFNNMLFPAIVQNSMTLGGGYDISKSMSIEASAVISPEVKKTVDVSAVMIAGGAPAGTYTNTTTHSQTAYSVALRYKF
ncbi:MAG: outer membrane protein transport protein [Gallionellaceae bacterium]|jgi:long-chain fatty acid transport protein